ncbi:energy transducer TonB [Pedobacter sp. D749]|uniref:energy transducer TonB n=1 Tax=Pedobacter sp. D749 TaxID=2856523 RepID=UPI001C598B55|nr:energy transducer TonB [Pedobacter sp. D749]QXU41399.1 energy transducer TonB [Pedobacter sp. D749]
MINNLYFKSILKMLKVLLSIIFLMLSQHLYSQGRDGNITINLKKSEENRVYYSDEVGVKAHFPNGEGEWGKYLLSNSRYPKMPKKNKAIGRIFLSFVIEKDGKITDAVITRGLNIKCDEEALRLLRSSGNWIAATLKSKNVRSKGNISIAFGLN